MIVVENIVINGKQFKRTYSDNSVMIERDGIRYDEAVDPVDSDREYKETDIFIESEEATDEDYLQALKVLGVSE
jgi:hypothetical protein